MGGRPGADLIEIAILTDATGPSRRVQDLRAGIRGTQETRGIFQESWTSTAHEEVEETALHLQVPTIPTRLPANLDFTAAVEALVVEDEDGVIGMIVDVDGDLLPTGTLSGHEADRLAQGGKRTLGMTASATVETSVGSIDGTMIGHSTGTTARWIATRETPQEIQTFAGQASSTMEDMDPRRVRIRITVPVILRYPWAIPTTRIVQEHRTSLET